LQRASAHAHVVGRQEHGNFDHNLKEPVMPDVSRIRSLINTYEQESSRAANIHPYAAGPTNRQGNEPRARTDARSNAHDAKTQLDRMGVTSWSSRSGYGVSRVQVNGRWTDV
jgi:hypothetical protein